MIKLNKYHVIDTATGHKARVTYSHFQMASTGELRVFVDGQAQPA